jgi:hypothetical protein
MIVKCLISSRDSYGAFFLVTKSGHIGFLRTACRTIFVRRAEYLAAKSREFVGRGSHEVFSLPATCRLPPVSAGWPLFLAGWSVTGHLFVPCDSVLLVNPGEF